MYIYTAYAYVYIRVCICIYRHNIIEDACMRLKRSKVTRLTVRGISYAERCCDQRCCERDQREGVWTGEREEDQLLFYGDVLKNQTRQQGSRRSNSE